MGAIVAGANQAIKVRADRVFVKKMPTKFEASARVRKHLNKESFRQRSKNFLQKSCPLIFVLNAVPSAVKPRLSVEKGACYPY